MLKRLDEESPFLPSLGEVRSTMEKCQLCPELAAERDVDREHRDGPGFVVHGDGNPDADILFIGTGPGVNEDRDGLPFVGESGRYLDVFLKMAEMTREDIWVTNVVLCHPPDNREPYTHEQANCRWRMLNEIHLVDPVIIIAAGAVAIAAITGLKNVTVGREAGEPRTVLIPGLRYWVPRTIVPVAHPANIYRSPGLQEHGPVHRVVTALKLAKDIVTQTKEFRGSPQ